MPQAGYSAPGRKEQRMKVFNSLHGIYIRCDAYWTGRGGRRRFSAPPRASAHALGWSPTQDQRHKARNQLTRERPYADGLPRRRTSVQRCIGRRLRYWENIGPAAIPNLVQLLSEEDEEGRRHVGFALTSIGLGGHSSPCRVAFEIRMGLSGARLWHSCGKLIQKALRQKAAVSILPELLKDQDLGSARCCLSPGGDRSQGENGRSRSH